MRASETLIHGEVVVGSAEVLDYRADILIIEQHRVRQGPDRSGVGGREN